jgi:hypothetical protein
MSYFTPKVKKYGHAAQSPQLTANGKKLQLLLVLHVIKEAFSNWPFAISLIKQRKSFVFSVYSVVKKKGRD